MRLHRWLLLSICLLTCLGCGRAKTTAELIGDLKSQQEIEKLTAVRLLPEHESDAAQVIPALIERSRT